MKDEIMVSVIMLTYNHECYISQALEGVLMQKVNFRYEILVGNDASTDRTEEIVKEYQKRYPDIIRLLSWPENIGGTHNSYQTMLQAKGRYLASCEGDDFWTCETKLQKQVDFLETHPEFSGCVHKVSLVDESGAPIKSNAKLWTLDKAVFTLKDFKGRNMPGHMVSMVRRNFFLDPSFDGTLVYKADNNIADRTVVLLWLARGDFFFFDECMASYRYVVHGSNMNSRLYKDNINRIRMDYCYTKRLEKYALNVLNIDGGFQYQKRDLFVRGILLSIMNPKEADKKIIWEIFKDADYKLWYLLGIIPISIKKTISTIRSPK